MATHTIVPDCIDDDTATEVDIAIAATLNALAPSVRSTRRDTTTAMRRVVQRLANYMQHLSTNNLGRSAETIMEMLDTVIGDSVDVFPRSVIEHVQRQCERIGWTMNSLRNVVTDTADNINTSFRDIEEERDWVDQWVRTDDPDEHDPDIDDDEVPGNYPGLPAVPEPAPDDQAEHLRVIDDIFNPEAQEQEE